MLILSLLILLLSNAVTIRRDKSILYSRLFAMSRFFTSTRRDKSILYSRLTISILIISSYLALDSLIITSEAAIDLYGGLFHATTISQSFQIFIFLISAIILQLTGFYPLKIWYKRYLNLKTTKLHNFVSLLNKSAIGSKLIKIWIYFDNYIKLLTLLVWSNQNMILWVIRGIRVVYMKDSSGVDVDMPDNPASDGDSNVYPPSVVDPERMAEYNALHHELSLKMDTMDNSISKADEDLDSLDDYAKKKELKIIVYEYEEGQIRCVELEPSKGRQDEETFLKNANRYQTKLDKIHDDIVKTEDLLKKTEKVNQDINKLDPEFSEDLKEYKDQISELKSKLKRTNTSSESSESDE